MFSKSFIIIFHPLRIDNLNQTLRFLYKREVDLEELILVCQTECKEINSPFNKTKQINMNLDSYWKSNESINIETKKYISADDVRALLSTAPGVTVMDNPKKNEYPNPHPPSVQNTPTPLQPHSNMKKPHPNPSPPTPHPTPPTPPQPPPFFLPFPLS